MAATLQSSVAGLILACNLIGSAAAGQVVDLDPGDRAALDRAERALATDPDSVDDHVTVQDLRVRAGETAAVAAIYAARLAADASPANRFLAARLSDDRTARLRALVDEHPAFAWGHWGLAQALAENAKLEREAFAAHVRAIETDPMVPRFYVSLADFLYGIGDAAAVLPVLDNGLVHLPGNLDLLANRAWYLNKAGREADALRVAEQVLAADPDHRLGMLSRAWTLTDLDRIDEAVPDFLRYVDLWPRSRVRAWGALCFHSFVNDALAEAEHACRRGVEVDPGDWIAAYFGAGVYQQRDWPVHILWYAQRALRAGLDDERTEIALGAIDYNMGHMGSRAYAIEVRLPRNLLPPPEELGEADHAAIGAADGAAWAALAEAGASVEGLDAVAAAHPGFAPAHYNRGVVLCCGEPSAAAFAEAVRLAPAWGRAIAAAAAIDMQAANYAAARAALATARTLDPGNADIEFNARLMAMFDEAVVAYTVDELRGIARMVADGGDLNLDTFEVWDSSFAGYLSRDPTSPEIVEAYGEIFAASPNRAYWGAAARYWAQAIELGGDANRLGIRIKDLAEQSP